MALGGTLDLFGDRSLGPGTRATTQKRLIRATHFGGPVHPSAGKTPARETLQPFRIPGGSRHSNFSDPSFFGTQQSVQTVPLDS